MWRHSEQRKRAASLLPGLMVASVAWSGVGGCATCAVRAFCGVICCPWGRPTYISDTVCVLLTTARLLPRLLRGGRYACDAHTYGAVDHAERQPFNKAMPPRCMVGA